MYYKNTLLNVCVILELILSLVIFPIQQLKNYLYSLQYRYKNEPF